MKPRILVFNGLKILQPRGISRFTGELVKLLEERSLDVLEIVIPRWIYRGPRAWKIAVLILYQQVVMPVRALRYRPALVIDPYNGYSIATSLAVPTLAVFHDFIPFQRKYWAFRPGTVYQRFLHKLAGSMPLLRVAFISQEVASEALAYMRMDRTYLLPNVIQALPFADKAAWGAARQREDICLARARGDVVVSTISGDGAHKDFDGLVRMLCRLNRSLTVVAFGFGQETATASCTTAGGQAVVTVVKCGPSDAAVIGSSIAESDLFVFHSLQEGFGRPICEALGCGKPVVSAVVPALASLSESAKRAVFSYATADQFRAAFEAARAFEGDIPRELFRRAPAQYYEALLDEVLGRAWRFDRTCR
jgi:glycosyltransferase involved in cell wall biosynthesis